MDLDGVVFDLAVEGIELVFDLRSLQQVPRARQQPVKQRPFARRKRDRLTTAQHAARCKVDVQRAVAQHRVWVAGIAPRDGAEPRRRFCQIEWFDEIIVGPRVQPLDPV